MSEAMSWSNTTPCVAESRQDVAVIFAPGRRRRLPVIGEIDVRLAHWLPGKLAEEFPLIVEMFWSKARIITTWGRGQVCRHFLISLYD